MNCGCGAKKCRAQDRCSNPQCATCPRRTLEQSQARIAERREARMRGDGGNLFSSPGCGDTDCSLCSTPPSPWQNDAWMSHFGNMMDRYADQTVLYSGADVEMEGI